MENKINTKTDKRIIKTKQRLINGFIQLLKTKNIKLLNVSELTNAAQVNRATFYLHYKDIDDFLGQIEEQLLAEYTAVFDKNPLTSSDSGNINVICGVFEFIAAHADIITAIVGPNGDPSFPSKLSALARRKIINEYSDRCDNDPENYYSIYYMINGCIGVIFKWIHGGMKESPEEMSHILGHFITNGVQFIQ